MTTWPRAALENGEEGNPSCRPSHGAELRSAGANGAQSVETDPGKRGLSTAMRTEQLYAMLRRMPVSDWPRLREVLVRELVPPPMAGALEALERRFREDLSLTGEHRMWVFDLVRLISASPPVLAHLRQTDERTKARVRWVLREMSDSDWMEFKESLGPALSGPGKEEEIRVIELALRLGESVTNIESAARALAQQISCERVLTPEVARRNALARGEGGVDPDRVFLAAKAAASQAEALAHRAQHTLACRYVAPHSAFKHARNTLFKLVDAILQHRHLAAHIGQIERELAAVPPVSRERLRWALHRMPIGQRMKVLKLVPLNPLLMHQQTNGEDIMLRATRDRRLAFDLFVRGKSEAELMAAYKLSLNALKNAVGMLLEALTERPLVRKMVSEFLSQTGAIEPMSFGEARRRLKQLTADQRAGLLQGLPDCAWKSRGVIHLHRQLFLDYFSGEWVLAALVNSYNLHKAQGLTGRFSFERKLTVRGANAAIEALIRKLSEEPLLVRKLRAWTSGACAGAPGLTETAEAPGEATLEQLLPPQSELTAGLSAPALPTWSRVPAAA
jgi:hypothetical protein